VPSYFTDDKKTLNMTRITILFSICVLNTTGCFSQKNELLSFFEEIHRDSTINTLHLRQMGFNFKDIPDPLAVRYFFDNNEDNLYAIGEAYNMDENTYTEVQYKRTVSAVFSKTIGTIVILSYWLDGTTYLALFNKTKDSIVATMPFRIPRPAAGEAFLHSILFPSNYIFSIETTHEWTTVTTRVKLIEIDFDNEKFIEHNNIELDSPMTISRFDMNFQELFELVGISEDGELINPKQ